MDGNSYFNLDTLPVCLTMIGDKINYLRCSDIRTLVNAKLRNYEMGDVCVQLDVDEYDQIVASFFKDEEPVGDAFVIRSTTQNELIEIINKVYNKMFNKKGKTMKKKISDVTNVTSVNQTDSINVNAVKDYILQHFSGSGHLYELDEMGALNVTNLCCKTTSGAIVNISFSDDTFTIFVSSGDSITCGVNGLSDEDLRKKVDRRLQTAIELHQELSTEVVNQRAQSDKEKNVVNKKRTKQKSLPAKKEVFRKKTTIMNGKTPKIKIVASGAGNKNALKKYNESVEYDINGLEDELKTVSYRSGGQRIRAYLLKKARNAGIRVEDTSTKWLVSILEVKQKELLCALYGCLTHKLPPFLSPYATSGKAAMRG